MNLTIDEIHKIRVKNYEETKGMTWDEYNTRLEARAKIAREKIAKAKTKKEENKTNDLKLRKVNG